MELSTPSDGLLRFGMNAMVLGRREGGSSGRRQSMYDLEGETPAHLKDLKHLPTPPSVDKINETL